MRNVVLRLSAQGVHPPRRILIARERPYIFIDLDRGRDVGHRVYVHVLGRSIRSSGRFFDLLAHKSRWRGRTKPGGRLARRLKVGLIPQISTRALPFGRGLRSSKGRHEFVCRWSARFSLMF